MLIIYRSIDVKAPPHGRGDIKQGTAQILRQDLLEQFTRSAGFRPSWGVREKGELFPDQQR
ncbi:MAG: hypothetical protein D3926_13555 [Desulfobacteraceae bacterium]|nr:MAG: hypothetical protein D3926_13555 [Desulfobacteraceae bacterium]